MSLAFIFPGQGSQTVGMGRGLADAFPAARLVFEEVDEALGEALTKVIWEGPAETLMLTENAQPGLMAVSLAAMRVLETEAGVDLARDARFVAGHSLGEYSALAAAGALGIGDTARLLRIRGRAMQKAVPVGTGAMAALLGLDFEQAVAVAGEAAARSGVPGRKRQWRRTGGRLGRQGRGRARGRDRQRKGCAARDDAARVRPVPLQPDATCGRRNGGGAGRGHGEVAGGAGRRQCAGQADPRSRRHRRRACCASYRDGTLARTRSASWRMRE